MTQKTPSPNYLRLSVPGDSVTREAIKAVDPLAHPALSGMSVQYADDAMRSGLYISMRMREGKLVSQAFYTALGRPDPYPQSHREALVEALADDYRLFGISSGRNHTEQLVRTFEELAVAQAKEHLGAGRG